MTMSGIFRTVTASAQRDDGATNYPALAPAAGRPAQQYQPISYPSNQIQPPAAYWQWPGQQHATPALPPQQQWPPQQPRTQRPYPAQVTDNGGNGRQ